MKIKKTPIITDGGVKGTLIEKYDSYEIIDSNVHSTILQVITYAIVSLAILQLAGLDIHAFIRGGL